MASPRGGALLCEAAREELVRAVGPACGRRRRLVVDRALFDARATHVRLLELFARTEVLRDALGWPPRGAAAGDGGDEAIVVPLVADLGPAAGEEEENESDWEDGERRQHLSTAVEPARVEDRVYLVRPGRLDVVREVASAIQATRRKWPDSQALVITLHRPSAATESALRECGVQAGVTFETLRLSFLPFEDDVLTLDIPHAHREILLDGENGSIFSCADGLLALEQAFDMRISRISAAGQASQLCSTIFRQRLREQGESLVDPLLREHQGFEGGQVFSRLAGRPETSPSSDQQEGARDTHLIIIDRDVDLVTPLLTQWTYEGLLDESFDMTNALLHVDISRLQSETASMISTALSSGSKHKGELNWKLNSSDAIYDELRHLNFWAAAKVLGDVASNVRDYYRAKPSRESSEMKQVKEYVSNLHVYNADHKTISIHTALAAEISARTFENPDFKRRYELERELLEGGSQSSKRLYISDCIARKDALDVVLRLCSLWSLTSGGIESDKFDFLRAEILASYGIEQLPYLQNLNRAGLFVRRDSTKAPAPLGSYLLNEDEHHRRVPTGSAASFSWNFARLSMKLLNDYDPDRAPEGDPSAPYSGYCPTSVRLVESALDPKGWDSLPFGANGNAIVPAPHSLTDVEIERRAPKTKGFAESGICVLFIGGITRAEISVLRRTFRSRKFLMMATTGIINGDTVVQAMAEQ